MKIETDLFQCVLPSFAGDVNDGGDEARRITTATTAPPMVSNTKIKFNSSVANMLDPKTRKLEEQVTVLQRTNLTSKDNQDWSGENRKFNRLDQFVQNGVFWSDSIESLAPGGFSDSEVKAWSNFSGTSKAVRIESGCGRMQNRKLVFENGTCACCRYRHNNDQIQGEIFSFYLSRVLGIHNVPPSSLALIGADSDRWARVRDQVTLAQWSDDRPVVMTKFLDHVVPAYIPEMLRKSSRHLHPTKEDLVDPNFAIEDLSELVQWTDLIIFDYLTANLDRVVNNMFNEQWNPDMMSSPAHNLVKVPDSGLLVFIDNESGLLHGYRLLEKYDRYHQALLSSICVFRRSTARAIAKLHSNKNIGMLLKEMFGQSEPEIAEKWLDNLPTKNNKMLKKRISSVHEHIENCRRTFHEDLRITTPT